MFLVLQSKAEMEAASSAEEQQQSTVALFMEIAAGQSDETARRFLQVWISLRDALVTHCID